MSDENPAVLATEDSAASAAAENARSQAEARRKRILEKAGKRLGVVSGEQHVEETEKQSSTSNAARIRAARAKRYGKKTGTTTDTGTSPSTPENPFPSTTAETTSGSSGGISIINTEGETVTEAAPTEGVDETVASPETPIKTTSSIDTKQPDSVADTTPPVKAETGEQIPSSKKKYQGVAKMRRKMLAKKKMEESDETAGSTSTGTIAGNKVIVPPKKVAILPICMHIVTILLLFGAGFDVGIQQLNDDVHIHTTSAVQEYGVPLLHRHPWKTLESLVSKSDGVLSLQDEHLSRQGKDLDVDEFNDTEEEYVPNIDPLFGVDLDELTKGPGLLNQLAKVAISMHRSILWLVYFTPISIFNSLIAFPMALIRMPPVLFVVAVVMRQVVGKALLGASIPEPGSDGNSDGGSNIEVISVAKNFIKNTLMTTFPKLMAAYDVFTHVRTDMYIVICGVFCGLVWTHFFMPVIDLTSVSSEGGKDEL